MKKDINSLITQSIMKEHEQLNSFQENKYLPWICCICNFKETDYPSICSNCDFTELKHPISISNIKKKRFI